MPTPYDGKIGLWHVYGGMIGENSIAEICATIKQYAPAVDALYVKISDGVEWMGAYEEKPDLAINSPDDIDRWVTVLNQHGLEFHAWALPKGLDPEREANLIAAACARPGVRSLIMDVEGGPGFFRGGRRAVRPLMTTIKRALGNQFHIGLSIDPRPNHYAEIFPDEWQPFVGSVHPQVYWGAFSTTPDAALKSAYATWGNYGVPVIPVLQAYQVSAATMDRARSQALYSYKAQGISWYVFGQIAAAQFKAVNVTIAGTSPDEGDDQTPAEPGKFGREIVITPTDAAFREGTYDGTPSPMRSFQNEVGWTSRYISTGTTMSQVWARWDPRISEGGFWEIAVYVPSQHATTNNARYKLHGVVGQATEVEVAIRQAPLENAWSSLGVFNLRANDPTAGVIFLNDLTREEDREIAFDAIRWRQITGITHAPSHVADGFDSPVGTIAERAASEFYPKAWFSSMQYGKSYYIGGDSSRPALHTGDDLFARAGEAATAHQPVFATASGVVVSAGKQTGTWGNVIVIRHDPYILSGQVVYSRYAHVETMQVKSGDRVVRGQYICNVGNAYGVFKYHLHFDISHTTVLQSRPWDWPGLNRTRLTENYVNPYEFVAKRRPS